MLPTFLVIGAMKAGTTSLHAYLSSHPDVFMTTPKEPNFFVEGQGWRNGVAWYESLFEGAAGARARGEASTSYAKHPFFQGVPARIKHVVPGVRLLYVLRHPIERMVSHYVHLVSDYGERKPLGEALLDNPRLFAVSDYASQIDRYLEHFDREQLLIVTSESLRDRRVETLSRIFRFLGIDDSWTPPNVDAVLHRSSEKIVPTRFGERVPLAVRAARSERGPRSIRRLARRVAVRPSGRDELIVPPEIERVLIERLRPTVERLRHHMGADVDTWGIADPMGVPSTRSSSDSIAVWPTRPNASSI